MACLRAAMFVVLVARVAMATIVNAHAEFTISFHVGAPTLPPLRAATSGIGDYWGPSGCRYY